MRRLSFAHLHVHSPFSFLDGASDMEVLVRAAAEMGCPALALTDHNTLAGAVRFQELCTGYGILPIQGAEITLVHPAMRPVGGGAREGERSHLTLLAKNRAGYASLCRLLSLAYAHGGRLTPCLPWEALPAHAEGLFCLTGCRKGRVHSLTREKRYDAAERTARQLLDWFGPDSLYIELVDDFTPDCHRVCRELAALAERLGVRDVVTNNVHYAVRRDVAVHDILCCIRAGITVGDAHEARPLNFERWLKPPRKMQELFWWRPQALANTLHLAAQCQPSLPLDEQVTPAFQTPEGQDAAAYLRHLVQKGALARYKKLTPQIQARLDHELAVIAELGYADYMLLAWKVARWSRKEGIRCTGRGSAADSCVAYSLLLTDVDVIQRSLPFARFLAPGKKPDIDLDFDSTRRDDVFEYIKREWGEPNVAMACTFHTYHAKGALRDVGKALGLSPDALRFFSENVSNFLRADQIEGALAREPGLKDHAHMKERFELLFGLCKRISGFPRHIGTHSSGVVISRVPLDTLAPVQPTARGVMPLIQLDKDDAETVGAIKLDVLSLRILSAVQTAEENIQRTSPPPHQPPTVGAPLVGAQPPVPSFRYDRIPREDEETYRLIHAGKAMGAFQLESPAQMALAVVLQPRIFEDLVASVALIRPGPVRSGAVKRFVACRNGWSRADVLHPCLTPILAKTYGCLIFQEQVVQVVAAMLDCSDAEADQFRKRLAKHDKNGTMDQARDEFLTRARKRHPDLTPERGQLIWEHIETWSGYGFTEGHAASFALTAQKSAYLVRHHPAEYFAAMISHQPMGYYASNTLAAEARRRGIQILPLDINASDDKCFAETPDTLRLGLRTVEDMREADIEAILNARKQRPFASLLDCCARVALHRDRVENLILCGAFDTLHSHRRGILWRLPETLALAHTYRGWGSGAGGRGPGEPTPTPGGGGQGSGTRETDPQPPSPNPQLDLGSAAEIDTPCAWDIEDFSPWDKFLWEWRLTGVAIGCHPLAYLRDQLAKHNVMTTHEAMQQPHGTRVTVAGLNLRPHRPPTRSGRVVLYTTIEDETEYLQASCSNEALDRYASVFLLSPAVVVRGILQRKGVGANLFVEKAKPLRLAEFATPPPAYPAPGTQGAVPIGAVREKRERVLA